MLSGMNTIRITSRRTAAMPPLGWTLWGAAGLCFAYDFAHATWGLLQATLGVYLLFLVPVLGIEHFAGPTTITRLLFLEVAPLLAGAVASAAALCLPAVRALPGARRVEVAGACALTGVLTTSVVILWT